MFKDLMKWAPWLIAGYVAYQYFGGRKMLSAAPMPGGPGSHESYMAYPNGQAGLEGLGMHNVKIGTQSGIRVSPQGGSRSGDSQGSTLSVKPQGSYNTGHSVSPSQCCLTPGLRMPGGLGVYG